MEIIIALVTTGMLAVIGLVFGQINEKNHYRSITEREKKYQHILIFNEKTPPPQLAGQPFSLAQGSVVMSSDYFKQIIAGFIQIFGGRITSYESMLDRGRREAILRMKEAAAKQGATIIFNVQLYTSPLNSPQDSKKVFTEILAVGTAWGNQGNRPPLL